MLAIKNTMMCLIVYRWLQYSQMVDNLECKALYGELINRESALRKPTTCSDPDVSVDWGNVSKIEVTHFCHQ